MRWRRGDEPETYHLTCPVCGALPGTSCTEDFQELERVHPSRRMSVDERNRRHAASGWEPPELAERRLGNPDTANVQGLQRAVGASQETCGRREAVASPRREPGSVARAARADPGFRSDGGEAWAVADSSGLTAETNDRAWLAAYLGAFPPGTSVPRSQLRGVANARWQGWDDASLRVSPARRVERLSSGRGGSSKGRRSSQKLSEHLRRLEDLGLIWRDGTRDAVVVADPAGLRQLADTSAVPGLVGVPG